MQTHVQRWTVFLLLWVALWPGQISADVFFKKPPPSFFKKGPYTFRLYYKPLTISPSESQYWWGASEDQTHYLALDKINGIYKGQRVFIWKSAYAGLALIEDGGLTLKKNGCVLDLGGGDAGVAYDMKLTFYRDECVSRRVDLGEFKDVVYEHTDYHYNHLNTFSSP